MGGPERVKPSLGMRLQPQPQPQPARVERASDSRQRAQPVTELGLVPLPQPSPPLEPEQNSEEAP